MLRTREVDEVLAGLQKGRNHAHIHEDGTIHEEGTQ